MKKMREAMASLPPLPEWIATPLGAREQERFNTAEAKAFRFFNLDPGRLDDRRGLYERLIWACFGEGYRGTPKTKPDLQLLATRAEDIKDMFREINRDTPPDKRIIALLKRIHSLEYGKFADETLRKYLREAGRSLER
jgi:hypothetical protein